MNKLIIKEREIKEKLIDLINNSELPAFILKSIIKDLWEQLNIQAENQYKEAQKEEQMKKEIEKLKGGK